MSAKSSTRLRLECLETRNLLSAVGLPLVPPVAPPSASAVPGEFSQIGGQHRAQAAMQGAVWNTAATPHAGPLLTPDQLSPSPGDSANGQAAGSGQLGDPTSEYDFHGNGDPTNRPFHHDLSSLRFSAEAAMDAPPPYGPADLINVVIEYQPVIESLPMGRGPAGFRAAPSRTVDEMVPAIVDNYVSPSVEPSMPPVSPAPPAAPVKAHAADVLAVSDTNEVGNQAFAALETSPSPSGGATNPPATNSAFLNIATTNSQEDGLITLDVPATMPRLGSAPSYNTYNTGFPAAAGGELDRGLWLTDVQPNTHTTADSARSSGKAAPAGENPAIDVSSRPAAATVQSAAGAEEGGGIELAIAAPSSVAAGDDSLPAGEATVANVAQQLAEMRPESGVGLFCDIEVATTPTLPGGGSASNADYPNAESWVAGTGIRGGKANLAPESVLASTRSLQPTMAGLADHLPLLLGVAVLVSRGGLRLEENVSERDRRLCCSAFLRQS